MNDLSNIILIEQENEGKKKKKCTFCTALLPTKNAINAANSTDNIVDGPAICRTT